MVVMLVRRPVREHGARFDSLSIKQHRAGAADRSLAADMRAVRASVSRK